MSRKAEQKLRRLGCKAFLLFVLLVSLSAALLHTLQISLAQSQTSEAPLVEGPNGAVTGEGFTLTPGNVDTSGWSERNKSVVVNFSLDRADGRIFRELRVENIEAELNKEPVLLGPNSLVRKRDSEPIKVLFMIDRSGSMINTKGSGGADKLLAARESLRHFVKNLGEQDEAAIAAFDLEQQEIVALTSDKKRLENGIGRIVSYNKDTNLYGSIKYALEKAKDKQIKNVIFLSDGMEDTPDSDRAKAEGRLSIYKRDYEQSLSKLARESGIRLFSIALGEPGNQETLKGVDYASLKNISDKTNGGTATLIDIPKLNQQAGGNSAQLNERLTGQLKDVLVEIKKTFRFAYALGVALPDLQEGEGELKLNFTVETDDKRITIPMVYTYSWDKSAGPPIFSSGRVLKPEFISITTPIEWSDLVQIYLLLLSPLVLLGLLPSVTSRIAVARELNRISHAIEMIGRNSKLQGVQCPNEMGPGGQRYMFKPGDTVLVCPKCQTPHHLSCWEYNQHQCMNRVCEYQFVVPERVLSKYGVASHTKGRLS